MREKVWMIIEIGTDGGGGKEPLQKRASGVDVKLGLEICRRLKLPYYGFILYHSGNRRLGNFLAHHLSLLDEVTGANFGIFTIVAEHTFRLRIDEIQGDGSIDVDLRNKIQTWRQRTIPFNPDKCFKIAESLGIPRTSLPCLIIFRTRSNGYRHFALLKLKDSWFPENEMDEKGITQTITWVSKLMDSLEHAMKIDHRKKALLEFQKSMDSLSREMRIYKPIFNGLKTGLMPFVQLPFKLVVSLSSIVEKAGGYMIGKKLKSITGDNKE